jgi:hypothetical protein
MERLVIYYGPTPWWLYFFDSSVAGLHNFKWRILFYCSFYLYLFISRRQNAEWLFTPIWNKWNDFSSVVFLMNTNLLRFVMILLSSLFMSPGLSRYIFKGLMKGMYCSLLKELPLWVVFPLACRSYQERFCRGAFITVWISLAFHKQYLQQFAVWKGNRTLLQVMRSPALYSEVGGLKYLLRAFVKYWGVFVGFFSLSTSAAAIISTNCIAELVLLWEKYSWSGIWLDL